MIYLTLIALASLIHAGGWMFAAPSRALVVVNRVSNEIRRFDSMTSVEMPPISESAVVRVALRFVGLGLVLLSLLRLHEIA